MSEAQICAIYNCTNEVTAQGLCAKHYQAWRAAMKDGHDWTPKQYIIWKNAHDRYQAYVIHCIENAEEPQIPGTPTYTNAQTQMVDIDGRICEVLILEDIQPEEEE